MVSSKIIKCIFLSITIALTINTFALASQNEKIAVPMQSSQPQPDQEMQSNISNLESQVSELESRISDTENRNNNVQNGASVGMVSFLYGAFCALWAQNNRRNALGWFIGGAIFTILAVLMLLWDNHNDLNQPPGNIRI